MRIYLKPNWSEQFIYGDDTPGFFVGRKHEIESLKNVITGNDSSAVLISSIRGVGKTSFVHKTLSEIDKVNPVFVNIGHALANADNRRKRNGEAENKKLILVSLIRATYFNKEFENDQKLGDLYKRCFGKYREENNISNEVATKKKIEIGGEIRTNSKTLIQLCAAIFVALGLSLESLLIRLILGLFGIATLFLSLNWRKEWTDFLQNKESTVIDDSTEYLEIEFESWLRGKKENKNKLVFVIDELDKIDETESFKMIKEYKNLFNRSFAHFLFISSQKSFDLISEDRENDANKGGIFPTMFTHVLYLSLPRTEELSGYLNEIFIHKDVKENEKKELIHYLLFRSGNDFFELKRLISDVLCFNEKEELYIDTEKIKEGDPPFVRISKLFEYVDQWFLQKNMRELKKHWRENSDLQKTIFRFLNKNFNRNFNEGDVNNNYLEQLVRFLLDIGILESSTVDSTTNPGTKFTNYQWTGTYRRNVKAPLLEEDLNFNKSFTGLIKLANDLDDLTEKYKTGGFQSYDSVTKGRDGQDISGINLYSTFSDYKDIFEKLKEPSQRISVTAEKAKEAREVVDEQINNAYKKYFDITIGFLNKIFKGKSNIFINENIDSVNNNIKAVFDSLPEFLSTVAPATYGPKVFGRTDQTRYVLMIGNFEDAGHIAQALSVLKARQDILIFNLIHGKTHQVSHPKIFIDKLGRKRKKGAEVKNFINVEFSDFRQLADVFKRIEAFLG